MQPLGKVVGKYTQEKKLGKGQFGEVWRCHHESDKYQGYAMKTV
jgi:serine/threonine protein kinase